MRRAVIVAASVAGMVACGSPQHSQPAKENKRSLVYEAPIKPLDANDPLAIPFDPDDEGQLGFVPVGSKWSGSELTFGFYDDGVFVQTEGSSLYSGFDPVMGRPTWQREFARALQTWIIQTPLNIRFLASSSADIMISRHALSQGNYLAYTYYPSNGDAHFNTAYPFYADGNHYDLYSVALHEFGHSFGLGHTAGSVMNSSYMGVLGGLTSDDVAGIQSLYGTRRADAYEGSGGNDSPSSAYAVDSTAINADITTLGDIDYYRVAASGSDLSASVDARLGLLSPKVSILDGETLAVIASAGDPAAWGVMQTASASGLVAGRVYFIVVEGAASDALGTGRYTLAVSGGTSRTPEPTPTPAPTPTPQPTANPNAPAAPSGLTGQALSPTQVRLSWTDNSANESSFVVQRSTNGSDFTNVGEAPSDATSITVSGLTKSRGYYFRIRAQNGSGVSDASNTIQLKMPKR